MPKLEPEKLVRAKLLRILEEHKQYNLTHGEKGHKADLSAYIIEDFNFDKEDLMNINHACDSVFKNCGFKECNLYGIDFSNSSFINADFRDANLGKAEFFRASLVEACFDYANLSSSEFILSNLQKATFREANLRGVAFDECNLQGVIFDDSDLEYASITNSEQGGVSWLNVKHWS